MVKIETGYPSLLALAEDTRKHGRLRCVTRMLFEDFSNVPIDRHPLVGSARGNALVELRADPDIEALISLIWFLFRLILAQPT